VGVTFDPLGYRGPMSWSYRPSLDGLRMVAVYLVVLFHSRVPWANGGFIGVDVFFVLSGFLVSNVILNEVDETGRLRLGRFYARRVRRLLPAALVVIVATSAVLVLFASLARRVTLVRDAQSALLYVANWHFAGASSDYFATDVAGSPFLHFWSLSVEEQFYLGFPLILVGLCLLARRRPWLLPAGLSCLFFLSLALQVYWAGLDTNRAYYGTDTRLYQLLAGALLAVLLRRVASRHARRSARPATAVGLLGVVVLGSGLVALTPSVRGIAAAAASTLLVAGLMTAPAGLLAGVLARPVPVFLGRISYGTYLWHWPVIVLLGKVLKAEPWVVALIAGAVATGLAAVSYEVLEMPVRRSPTLERLRWSTALVGVSASVLVAIAVVPPLLRQEVTPALLASPQAPGAPGSVVAAGSAGREAAQQTDQPAAQSTAQPTPQHFDWQAIQEAGLPHGYACTAADVSACLVVSGSGATMLVVGDSQAQMLTDMFAKMARAHGLSLYMNALPGCLWQEELVNTRRPQQDQDQCAQTRVGWYDEALRKIHPDVVILAERPYEGRSWEHRIRWRDGGERPLAQMTLDATRRTLADLEKQGARPVLMERVVVPSTFDPLDCLSGSSDPSRCAVPMPVQPSRTDAFYITAATESPAVSVVDFNPAFCPGAPVCQPIVDGQVVWLNAQHVTPAFAASREAQAWTLLSRAGATAALE
jgi:peptidoglycan/LPS O-acetylase OafA/YrhL